MTQLSFSRSTLRPPQPAQPRCRLLEHIPEVYLHQGPHQVPQGHCPGRGGGGRQPLHLPDPPFLLLSAVAAPPSLRRRTCPWVLGLLDTLVRPRNSQPRILTRASTPPCRTQTVSEKKQKRSSTSSSQHLQIHRNQVGNALSFDYLKVVRFFHFISVVNMTDGKFA